MYRALKKGHSFAPWRNGTRLLKVQVFEGDVVAIFIVNQATVVWLIHPEDCGTTFFETSVIIYQSAYRNNPGYLNLQQRRCQRLRSSYEIRLRVFLSVVLLREIHCNPCYQGQWLPLARQWPRFLFRVLSSDLPILRILIWLAHFRNWFVYTQKVDAVYSSDILVSIYGTTCRHVPEYHNLNVHFRQNTNLRSWCDICVKRLAALVYQWQ